MRSTVSVSHKIQFICRLIATNDVIIEMQFYEISIDLFECTKSCGLIGISVHGIWIPNQEMLNFKKICQAICNVNNIY